MNIFVLSTNALDCAEMHCDKHVVKMILEYAQLLSTAHRVLDGSISVSLSKSGRKQKRYVLSDDREFVLYASTHHNHPCAVWVRESSANYAWLLELFGCLLHEYQYRYHKVHATARLQNHLSTIPVNITYGALTPFPQCMPYEYHAADTVDAYRSYYINEKKDFAKYTNRNKPNWL